MTILFNTRSRLFQLIVVIIVAVSMTIPGGTVSSEEPDENLELLNCLCSCLAPPGGQFACSYNTEDRGWSPSCRDLSNGPCICKAYGCFRGPLPTEGECYDKCYAKFKPTETQPKPEETVEKPKESQVEPEEAQAKPSEQAKPEEIQEKPDEQAKPVQKDCKQYCKERFSKEGVPGKALLEESSYGEYPDCGCWCRDESGNIGTDCFETKEEEKKEPDEEEICNKKWQEQGAHMIGVIDDNGDCVGQCELGWTMQAAGCVDCNTICSKKANYVFSKKDSSPNQCTCVCADGYTEEDDKCVKLKCAQNAEPVGNECRCKTGFKKADDGKNCVPYDKKQALQDLLMQRLEETEDENEKLMLKQMLNNLLRQRIQDTKDEQEKLTLMKFLNDVADVPGHYSTIIGGWDGIAKTIYSIFNKGERPSLDDLKSIYALHTLKGMKKWFENMGKKTQSDLVFDSKRLNVTSQHGLDDVVRELKNGDKKTIRVKYRTEYRTHRALTGYGEEKETNITVVKGPDGTIMYTLDGKEYFDGKDLDKQLDPSVFKPVADAWNEIKRKGLLGLTYKGKQKRLLEMFANQVHREFNTNVEANKKRRDKLISEMGKKAYENIVGRMKSFIESGYEIGGKSVTGTIDFLNYSIQTTGTQAIERDFSKIAILYGQARSEGHSQKEIRINMREQIFYGIGIKNADTFQVNANEQILLDQLEKVYQRYKIYEETY